MRLIKRMIMIASLTLLTLFAFNCGDKSTGGPASSVPVAEPFDEDTMAVRKILDTNRLTGVAVGEVITSTVVIDRKTNDAVKRIGELKLQNRNISVIPQHLGQLTGLTLLDLDSNKIGAIPAAIGKCAALGFMTAASNSLTGLPAEMGKLDSLKTLILSHNSLASLPAEIGGLRALERLQVDFNSLAALPPLTGMTKLKIVWLNNNNIAELPAGMDTSNIQYIVVGNNKLCPPDGAAIVKWLNMFAESGWKSTQACQ
jgi:Leucine-rich repeat (LRR) protein